MSQQQQQKKEMNNVKMIIERSENSIKDMNASESCCVLFLPINDGENWSRKNIFEIPPCEKLPIFSLLHKWEDF